MNENENPQPIPCGCGNCTKNGTTWLVSTLSAVGEKCFAEWGPFPSLTAAREFAAVYPNRHVVPAHWCC